MITVDAPISFLLGSGIVYVAARKGIDHQTLFAKAFILQTVILSPVILFFMIRFPDWEWNYLFDAQTFFFGEGRAVVGATWLAIIMALLNLTFIAGFKLAGWLVDSKQHKQLLFLLAGILSLIGLTMLAMLQRALYIGTLEEFQTGQAQLIFVTRDFLLAQGIAVILLSLGFFQVVKKDTAKVPIQ